VILNLVHLEFLQCTEKWTDLCAVHGCSCGVSIAKWSTTGQKRLRITDLDSGIGDGGAGLQPHPQKF